ncbi:MAG: peptidoglycan-binding protein [Gammaproteobacteria bacterium]|nr:MAG: peptidoglycan-binding protein [Gammaproteobacteria bacterium]
MKFSKISKLVAYTILLLSVGLLIGCKPIFEKKPLPKENKDAAAAPAAAPAAPAPAAPAPAAPASAAPAPAAAPAEPAAKVEDVQSIQSIESAASAQAQPTAAAQPDDGDDVVKVTPTIMRKVQQALVDAGFKPGAVDGVSGAKTVAAIESFQKQNNIPVGKVTKRTLRALGVDF